MSRSSTGLDDEEDHVRRDRDGSPLELDQADAAHVYVDGWLDFDPDDRPTPCLTCRPHLAARRLTHAR